MFLRRDKMQMVSAEDALPGRATRPFSVPDRHFVLDAPLEPPFPDGLQQAIFGMGCFWGAERKFWETPGVYTTAVGYAGGFTPNPTYEEVCSGRTGHNEAVLVVFDPAQVSYERCCACSGRTTTRRRACARATTSARSTAPASTPSATSRRRRPKRPARCSRRRSKRSRFARSPRRSLDAPTFFYAEDYHQQYLAKNPMGYCGLGGTGVSCPIGVARRVARQLTGSRTVDDEDELPEIDPYVDFTRKQWSRLRASTPLTLDEADVAALRGLNEPFALERGRRRLPAALATVEPPVRRDP